MSYDAPVSEHLPSSLYPDFHLTGIRANYLGNRDLPKLDVFEFSSEHIDQRYSNKQQKRISLLEFFFSFVGGQLKLGVEYSNNFHKAETINRLGKAYMHELEKLISTVQEGPSVSNEYTIKPINKVENTSGLEDKVALITGAGRGIGRSIASAMAREGIKQAILSKSIEPLRETAEIIESMGIKPLMIQADICNMHEVQVAEKVIEEFGKIDILVNNAGVTKIGSLQDMSPQEWTRIIEVNLIGTYNMCYAVIPYLMEQKHGKVINLGSDSSLIGYPLMSAYAASKHGVLGLTRSLAEELKPHHIQVNSICPAFVDTDMTPSALRGAAIPTEKIANVVSFLASSNADCITGEEIKVYGQQDMYWFGSKQIPMLKGILSKNEFPV